MNLLDEILVTSGCTNCNANLRLDFPNKRFFPLSIDPWQEEYTEDERSKHHKYRGSLSGKRMNMIFPFISPTPNPAPIKEKKRRKRKRWSSNFDLLLRGCLNLFGTNLKKISLIIPEFNSSFIVKKIKRIKWLQLTLSNEKYRSLTEICKGEPNNDKARKTDGPRYYNKGSPHLVHVNATKEEESGKCTTPVNIIDKCDSSTFNKCEKTVLKEHINDQQIIKSPFVFDRLRRKRESLVFATPIQVINKSFSLDEMGSKFINISPGGYQMDDLESESHFTLFN
jgi:hypothetical protein